MESWSNHANRRSAQRSVPIDHIELALQWGHEIRQGGGRIAYHLGRREARDARTTGVGIPERAVGLAVVIARDGTVVTVVRSPDRERLRAHGRCAPHRRIAASRR
ncbi:MAG: hypothetical protein V4850_03820 [Myxococcota bacterium]